MPRTRCARDHAGLAELRLGEEYIQVPPPCLLRMTGRSSHTERVTRPHLHRECTRSRLPQRQGTWRGKARCKHGAGFARCPSLNMCGRNCTLNNLQRRRLADTIRKHSSMIYHEGRRTYGSFTVLKRVDTTRITSKLRSSLCVPTCLCEEAFSQGTTHESLSRSRRPRTFIFHPVAPRPCRGSSPTTRDC